jgi:hypothetical protein
MEVVEIYTEPSHPLAAPVLSAQELTRQYGEGETAVHACGASPSTSQAASSPPSWARQGPGSRR